MKTLAPLALAIALACTGPAAAGLVQFNAFLDISACPNFGPGLCLAASQIPTTTIAVGDTVDYNVTFGGSRMRMFDDDGGEEGFAAWLFYAVTPGFFTISDASIDFLDLLGTLVNPLTLMTQTDGLVHIGPTVGVDFIGTGESISIAGYHVQFKVDALDFNPSAYEAVAILVGVDRMEVANSAPEPTFLALFGLGVAGMVVTRRRRGLRMRYPAYICKNPVIASAM